MASVKIIWQDRKRPFFGLPLSFTVYTLTEEKLLIDTGILSRRQEEVRLYRITDFSVRQNIFQRLFGVGNIHISSSDNMQGDFVIIDVKSPYKIKEMLSDMVEVERGKKGTGTSEFLR